MLVRPLENEHIPYFRTYISLVPEGDLATILSEQFENTITLFEGLTEEQWSFRYADDKWTVKEVLGHIIDTEMVMNFRMLHTMRSDSTPLFGFDQDVYANNADYHNYTTEQLLAQYKSIRQFSLATIQATATDTWLKQGKIDDQPISARALAYIITGHELHHLKILKEKYLI